MQKPFVSHPALFVTSADLEHPSLQGLDGAEAVLDWAALEQIMAGIYARKTGRPGYSGAYGAAMRRHFMRTRL